MRISIFGAGYVGLTTAAVLAENGHHILLIERISSKIASLMQGNLPFYEPDLDDLVRAQLSSGRIQLTDKVESCEQLGDVAMICVGTPPQADGSPNLQFLASVIDTIVSLQPQGLLLVTKSSVPPGTNAWLAAQMEQMGVLPEECMVASNPEFLREGTALADTRQPSRIVWGFSSDLSNETLAALRPTLDALYAGMDGPVLQTTWESAELIKYASNAFLANKISFANELTQICDAYGADIRIVTKGMGMDPRIGPAFLGAGLGYGGSCLPKDLAALQHAAAQRDVTTHILPAIAQVNAQQIENYVQLLTQKLAQQQDRSRSKPRIAVWGIAFKPDTDDTRMSPAVALIDALLAQGMTVTAFDPVANYPDIGSSNEKERSFFQADHQYDTLTNADALIVCTEWSTFRFDQVDWTRVRTLLAHPLVIDTRNIYEADSLSAFDLQHIALARPSAPTSASIR